MTAEFELQVNDLVICRQGKLILDHVSFSLRPGTLTAIIGPNGAGKSTLMRALTGERPQAGQVLINGQDLYAAPDYWLRQIGYVPEDNILHDTLTIEQALQFIGRIRLPHFSAEEINARVDDLLARFGFGRGDERRHKPLRLLSTGERKRANVCSELVIDPPILMLDEPTSNLDANAERDLMQRLADYAHESRKTVLVITHTLNTLVVCDQVYFIENSRLSAAGPAGAVIETLEKHISAPAGPDSADFYRWAAIFHELETRPRKRNPDCGPTAARRTATAASGRQRAITIPWLFQFRWLLARYWRVRLGDPWGLLGTVLAGCSGVLFFTLPGRTFVRPFDPGELGLALNLARQSVYVVALVATLLGLITSYTEISKEYRIYRHERLKGLSPSAYFMSKWLWLTVLVGILAPLLLVLFLVLVYNQPLPDYPEPRYGESVSWLAGVVRFQLVGLLTRPASWLVLATLILACITSTTLGLLISALAGDSGKGYLYLSFVVVFMVLFSGLIHNERLETLIETFSFASTGKWAYKGLASSLRLYCWTDDWRFDEFPSTGHLLSIWLALLLFTLTAATLAVLCLRLRDPWAARTSNARALVAGNSRKLAVLAALLIMLFSYTVFLRHGSRQYHSLNYWSEQKYGGSGAFEYGQIGAVTDATLLQQWNGAVSGTWCGKDY